MKRSGFKKKPRKPLKKGTLRKQSKQKISKLQVELWALCKQIIRKKYKNECYTCPAVGLIGLNWHTGHLWAKASLRAFLKYDLRVLRPQCYSCNMNKGGMGADFYKRMLKEIGEEKMTELQNDRQKLVNAYDHYNSLIIEYQKMLETM